MTESPPKDELIRLNHLMRWTLRAFYWLDESLQNLLEVEGWARASHTETMVILAIGEGTTRPSELSRLLGISRQAVHQVVTTLVRKGLISLQDDPQDKRSKILVFNSKAVKIRKSAIKAVEQIEREVAKRVGQQKYRGMVAGLSQHWGDPIGAAPDRKIPGRRALAKTR